jgi:ABC-type transport system substrate-binding protein
MEIEAIEFRFYVKDVWVAKNADLTLAWYTREADPDGMFSSVLRKDQGNNFMGYHNPAVEELFDAAKIPQDREKRKAGYERLLRVAMLEDVPLVKVQTVEIAWAANDKVQGLVVQPKGTPNIYQWEWRG